MTLRFPGEPADARGGHIRPSEEVNMLRRTTHIAIGTALLAAAAAFAPAAHADRVGFNVSIGGPGYGVSFGNAPYWGGYRYRPYWGPAYVAPPVVYAPPVYYRAPVVYRAPRVVYRAPYVVRRPVVVRYYGY
jgi:hypothetical protein